MTGAPRRKASSRRSDAVKKVEEETYARDDQSLWDDAYLLKLFNEQLENSTAVQSTLSNSADDISATEDDASSADREASTTATSVLRSTAGQPRAEGVVDVAATPTVEKQGSDASSVSIAIHVPSDMVELVQAFYRAGYESGRRVGYCDAVNSLHRKRGRGSS